MTKYSNIRTPALLLAALLGTAMTGFSGSSSAAEDVKVIPAPAVDQTASGASETVVLAGGCFWGVQGVFQHVKGVTSAVSGLYRRREEHRGIRDGEHRFHRARRIGRRDVRSAEDQLRQDPPDLLLCRPQSDRAQPAGARQRHAIPFRDLPGGCGAGENREGLYRATQSGARFPPPRSSPRSSRARRSIAPRATIRII